MASRPPYKPGQAPPPPPPLPTKTTGSKTKVTLQEVVAAGQKAGISADYMPYWTAIVYQESGGNFDPAPNSANAIGPAQVVGFPAPKANEDIHAWALKNLAAGAAHFQGNISAFPGDIQKAIAAYYIGTGNVQKYGISTVKPSPNDPSPRDYVNSVLSYSTNISNVWADSTPAARTLKKALQAAADAGNQQLISNRAVLSGEEAYAKAVAHTTDPWVTIVKNPKTGATMFSTSFGFNPPKNTLEYNGQPLTKSELSSVWSARYADIWESYTGRTPTPDDIVNVLQKGLSAPGLQQALAGYGSSSLQSFNQLKESPIYKQTIQNFEDSAHRIIGQDAPQALIQKALALKWDTTAFEEALRTYTTQDGARPWLQGPEFQNNYGSMQTVFQKIYGVPTQQNQQAIKEAAANGWSQDQFASYLRSQPEYTTSLEYQDNAVNFLDQMGLLLKSHPVMTTPQTPPSGGTTVPNSPLVPGRPGTIVPQLDLKTQMAETLGAPPAEGTNGAS